MFMIAHMKWSANGEEGEGREREAVSQNGPRLGMRSGGEGAKRRSSSIGKRELGKRWRRKRGVGGGGSLRLRLYRN